MKTTDDELAEILGYIPSKGQKLEILKQMRETGKSIYEVTALYQMPAMFIKDDAGLIEHKGEKITPEEFASKHPFRKFVTIGGPDEKLIKNNKE